MSHCFASLNLRVDRIGTYRSALQDGLCLTTCPLNTSDRYSPEVLSTRAPRRNAHTQPMSMCKCGDTARLSR